MASSFSPLQKRRFVLSLSSPFLSLFSNLLGTNQINGIACVIIRSILVYDSNYYVNYLTKNGGHISYVLLTGEGAPAIKLDLPHPLVLPLGKKVPAQKTQFLTLSRMTNRPNIVPHRIWDLLMH